MNPQPPHLQPPELPSPFTILVLLATSILARDFLIAAIALGVRR